MGKNLFSLGLLFCQHLSPSISCGQNERVVYLRKEIINNFFSVYKLLLLNVGIRVSGERSSSTARRLKTVFPRLFEISSQRKGAFWKQGD